jgi:predicted transglutaminase-like cysteine proteinase
MRWFCSAACAVLAMSAALSPGAHARVFRSIEIHGKAAMRDGPDTTPPPGFVDFCRRKPDACINRGTAAPTKLTLNGDIAETLVRVNEMVNRAIRYETSVDHYGYANAWMLDPIDGYGNCEDYSVSKREALRAAGLPDQALRIAIVQTPSRDYHAVLTVDTDKGVLVLDNVRPDIHDWEDTPYTWLKRQAADDPLRWVSLDPNP